MTITETAYALDEIETGNWYFLHTNQQFETVTYIEGIVKVVTTYAKNLVGLVTKYFVADKEYETIMQATLALATL